MGCQRSAAISRVVEHTNTLQEASWGSFSIEVPSNYAQPTQQLLDIAPWRDSQPPAASCSLLQPTAAPARAGRGRCP